jgi:Antitoxin-like ribbon-helix-helix
MTENRTPERNVAVIVRMSKGMRKELKQCALDRDTSMNELLRRAAEDLLDRTGAIVAL